MKRDLMMCVCTGVKHVRTRHDASHETEGSTDKSTERPTEAVAGQIK